MFFKRLYDISDNLQKWLQFFAGVIVVFAGWFIIDLVHTSEIRSMFEIRLKTNEESVKSIRATLDQLSIESANTHTTVMHLDSIMKQINANVETRTASMAGVRDTIEEIHRTVAIGAEGQARNLREVEKIIAELGKQICSQQQCNSLQQEIYRKK